MTIHVKTTLYTKIPYTQYGANPDTYLDKVFKDTVMDFINDETPKDNPQTVDYFTDGTKIHLKIDYDNKHVRLTKYGKVHKEFTYGGPVE